MNYAVKGDSLAALEALEVVLEGSRNQKCIHYCCVGDVVGYNAIPKECPDIIRGMDMPRVHAGSFRRYFAACHSAERV